MPRSHAVYVKSASIEAGEIAQFSAHAADWWNPDGKFRPLHRLNPVRVEYMRDRACAHFGRNSASRQSLKGLSVLDVGCGGGLLAEPMARLGAHVTGIDASGETIDIARQHAKASHLSIDYAVASVEDLVRQKKTYDMITALEVAEHVADMESFFNGLAKLLKPDGLLVMSTLNRTPKSFLLGIVAAEYVLGWVPRGTHQWQKFIRPSELVQRLEDKAMQTTDITGLVFNPLRNAFELNKNDLAVNYMLTASFL
jgi:2-polyprenyl-6-hydroxyphenyl methylase/3-demethylubiquinone-9 3-methyltransferase